jgi:hypothetical protein
MSLVPIDTGSPSKKGAGGFPAGELERVNQELHSECGYDSMNNEYINTYMICKKQDIRSPGTFLESDYDI